MHFIDCNGNAAELGLIWIGAVQPSGYFFSSLDENKHDLSEVRYTLLGFVPQ